MVCKTASSVISKQHFTLLGYFVLMIFYTLTVFRVSRVFFYYSIWSHNNPNVTEGGKVGIITTSFIWRTWSLGGWSHLPKEMKPQVSTARELGLNVRLPSFPHPYSLWGCLSLTFSLLWQVITYLPVRKCYKHDNIIGSQPHCSTHNTNGLTLKTATHPSPP